MPTLDSPSLPHLGIIPGDLQVGSVIRIDGHIAKHGGQFEINLICSSDASRHSAESANIALHLRCKTLRDSKLICNSRSSGNWAQKEKHKKIANLRKNNSFSLIISVEAFYYGITINDKFVCRYVHRMPFQEVRSLHIEGKTKIDRIEFRNDTQIASTTSTILYPSAPPAYYESDIKK